MTLTASRVSATLKGMLFDDAALPIDGTTPPNAIIVPGVTPQFWVRPGQGRCRQANHCRTACRTTDRVWRGNGRRQDGTLGASILEWCEHRVMVPTRDCMNLAASVNVVLYDRMAKQ